MYQNDFYARAQVPSNNIIWVQGIEGAKAQQIKPGVTLLLLDSENDQFYIKACDQYGICLPIKTFKFEEVVTAPAVVQAPAAAQYVTREELTEILKEFKLQNEQPIQSTTTKYTTIKQQPGTDSKE